IRAACLGLVSSKNDEAIWLPSEQGGKIQIIRELLLKCHFGISLIPKSPHKRINEVKKAAIKPGRGRTTPRRWNASFQESCRIFLRDLRHSARSTNPDVET